MDGGTGRAGVGEGVTVGCGAASLGVAGAMGGLDVDLIGRTLIITAAGSGGSMCNCVNGTATARCNDPATATAMILRCVFVRSMPQAGG